MFYAWIQEDILKECVTQTVILQVEDNVFFV